VNSLRKLVRAHRFVLDEKRQKLADLERLHDKLVRDIRSIEKSDDTSGAAVGELPSGIGLSFTAAERRRKLCHSVVEVERSIEAARGEVEEAEVELKRHELAAANRGRDDHAKTTKGDGGWVEPSGNYAATLQ
jgi:multidrug resistance efflux pump